MKEIEVLRGEIRKLRPPRRDYMEKLFYSCPEYVLQATELRFLKKKEEFIRAGESIDSIYIIIRGKARGLELNASGNMYAFREFLAGDILGDFEALGGLEKCRVSVFALEPCETLVIPTGIYLKWMRKDVDALFLRVQDIMRRLTYQISDERALFAITCRERLILYLTQEYREKGHGQRYKFHMTQAELADCLGFSVRTVQRNLNRLMQEGLITLEAGKVCIEPEQYRNLTAVQPEAF